MAQSALIAWRGAVVDLSKASAACRYSAASIVLDDGQEGGDEATQLHEALMFGARAPWNTEGEQSRVAGRTLNDVAVALFVWVNES